MSFEHWEKAAQRQIEIDSRVTAEEGEVEALLRSRRLRDLCDSDVWLKDIEPEITRMFLVTAAGMRSADVSDAKGCHAFKKMQAASEFCMAFRAYIEGSIKKGELIETYKQEDSDGA